MVHRALKLTWVILKSPVLFPVHACCERTDMLDHLCFTPVSIDFKPTYLAELIRLTGLEEIALITVLKYLLESA